MLAIRNNLMAEMAARHLGKSYAAMAKSVERLASGLRINSAKDDAAGMAVRELIRGDVAALKQGSRNAADAVSMIQTAEGGLAVIDDVLVRMRELAEQAATGSYSDEQKQVMQEEFAQLAAEIDRIANNTAFNSNKLLTSDAGTVTFALGLGLGANKTISVEKHQIDSEGLGIGGQIEYLAGEEWVPTTATNYITNAVASAQTWQITITGQDNIDVSFAASETKTLAAVVTAINYASRATDENYDAAEAVYNSETDQYTLKISAAAAGDVAIAFTANVNIDWAAGLQGAGDDVAATDFNNEAGSGTTINIKTDPTTAIAAIDAAIEEKDQYRAHLGYMMNRLEAAASVIDIQAENLLSAESRISDVDVAAEMARLTRNQVLAQAGVAMLAQANMMPQMALQLLS